MASVRAASFPRHLLYFCALISVMLPASRADTWIPIREKTARPAPPQTRVTHVDADGLSLAVEVPGLALAATDAAAGRFTRLTCPETRAEGAPGAPALPVIRRLFCTPPDAPQPKA